MQSKPIIADLNFIKPDTTLQPEVIYTGKESAQTFNDAYQFMPTPISDAREIANNTNEIFSIHKQGFKLTAFKPKQTDFDNAEAIRGFYYQEVIQLIKEQTAANHVFVFDHTVRKAIPGSTRRPAQHIHNDYTHESGVSVAEESIDSESFAAMKGKRMIQINVWRTLNGTVKRSPLTLCDASSIDEADLVKTHIHFQDSNNIYPEKTGEIFALKQNPKQRWLYFPEITANEAILIKGYDTDLSGVARFTPHTAFEYPNQEESAKPRHSIEARAFAFFD